jgi:tRNA1Val (adenine37-N6)-methyltransferase
MPNTYFQFKEFRIEQGKCSMKVCTDACIFGSWIAAYQLHANNCLDIGTGTGLLSLMYTQKNANAIIDAVEIEREAYEQARENFVDSKWNHRLHVFNEDIKAFAPAKKYDLIISNPPFYENDLLSEEKEKNIAKHSAGLNFKDLINCIKDLLKEDGYFTVLLPYHRLDDFIKLADENNFFLKEKVLIRQTPKHNFFRGILLFSSRRADVKISELIIKDQEGSYSDEFIAILKDYYLDL